MVTCSESSYKRQLSPAKLPKQELIATRKTSKTDVCYTGIVEWTCVLKHIGENVGMAVKNGPVDRSVSFQNRLLEEGGEG